jgi:tellurite resistance protein
VEKEKLAAMENLIKSHKKLSVDSIIKINRAMGMLFSMLELKIKFSKMFNRIAEIMQKNSISENDIK